MRQVLQKGIRAIGGGFCYLTRQAHQGTARQGTPAKLIKIGDKICNVREITPTQPAEWPLHRKLEYLGWAEKGASGRRDCDPDLEQHLDAVLKKSRESLV